ncbi:recombinase family protein [Streptomyces sp. TRM68367]|uniref:recombinase family protein n=1 Tax=Streptomyces sp. TRM68367 TaxID=2758415 RepID=UPI00293471C6|nr:recombinase family protein [Streptomyces sp. TRM68367]
MIARRSPLKTRTLCDSPPGTGEPARSPPPGRVPPDLPGADQHPRQGAARTGEGSRTGPPVQGGCPRDAGHLHRHELKRLARNAAELMTLSAELQAGGIQLELLTGPLTGIYDPNGMGAMFFAVLAVAGQIERNYIREKTLEGQVTAAAKGNHGGRPKVIDDDMLTFAVALKDKGLPVPDIAKELTIKTGKNAGQVTVGCLPLPGPRRNRAGRRGRRPAAPAQARPHPPTRGTAHPRRDRPPRPAPGSAPPKRRRHPCG